MPTREFNKPEYDLFTKWLKTQNSEFVETLFPALRDLRSVGFWMVNGEPLIVENIRFGESYKLSFSDKQTGVMEAAGVLSFSEEPAENSCD